MTLCVALVLILVAAEAAVCPPGSTYDSSFDKCYQFFSTPMSFLDAEQTCNSIGGHLSDVQNSFENSLIAGIAAGNSSKTPNFWIGANLLRGLMWSWTTTASMSYYSNWGNGQPVNSNPCAYVYNYGLTWVTLPCNSPLPFMCTIDPNSTIPFPLSCPTQLPPTPLPTTCPSDAYCTDGYTLYSGNCMCYKYYTSTESFSDASATCARNGGMLAKIPSRDVDEFLTTLPGIDCGGYTCPYIGLTCTSKSASSCTWADGTPLGDYINFSSGPSAQSFALVTTRTIVNTGISGMWEGFHDNRYFICQKGYTRPIVQN